MLEASVTVSPNLEGALRALKPDVLARVIGAGMVKATELIKGQIERKRLTGNPGKPWPVAEHRLRSISGTLRKSVYYSKTADVNGDAIRTHIGSNVKYAAAHEFGFTGNVKVKPGRMKITQVFGRKLASPLTANRRAFTRRMRVPERAPIRTGIKDHFALIDREIQRAVKAEFSAAT